MFVVTVITDDVNKVFTSTDPETVQSMLTDCDKWEISDMKTVVWEGSHVSILGSVNGVATVTYIGTDKKPLDLLIKKVTKKR